MLPIRRIADSNDAAYLKYLYNKTGFLVSKKSEKTAKHLWLYVNETFNFAKDCIRLTEEERQILDDLLANFGHLNADNKRLHQLESKLSWVYRHPQGGIFIPLEVYKLLMQEPELIKQNYLFTLLYLLKLKEQKALAALLGGQVEARLAITFEKNPLDMALVLYIWFSKQIFRQPPKIKIAYPDERTKLWDFYRRAFGHRKHSMVLKRLLLDGKKGFFRSLSLFDQNEKFVQMFTSGAMMPVFSQSDYFSRRVESMRVVSPRELYPKFIHRKVLRLAHE